MRIRGLSTTLLLASAGVALTGCQTSGTTDVRIPRSAAHTDLAGAYDILHRAGLRVSVPPGVSIASLADPSARLSPPAGTRVAAGSAVMLIPGAAAVGSPAVSQLVLTRHKLLRAPRVGVPDFVGRTASVAIRWAGAHRLFWALSDLPALHASDAPHLYDAYRVVAQRPRPGRTIAQGVRVDDGFRPTPLTLTVTAAT